MTAESKWLTDVCADDSLEDIAAVALRRRLETVRGLMVCAMHTAPTMEVVHQLRVGVRRTRAALRFFKPLLPPKRAAAMNKALRRIRRSAGTIRDLDVMMIRFAQLDTLSSQPETKSGGPTAGSFAALVGQLDAERQSAEKVLHRRLLQQEDAIASARLAKLLSRTRWRQEGDPPSWTAFVDARLSPSFGQFKTAASAAPESIEALHRLRILGKQLRYALELSVSIDPAIRTDLCPTMEAIQERLGAINDHAVAANHLRSLKKRRSRSESNQAVLKDLIGDEKTQLADEIDAFNTWWNADLLGEIERKWYAIFRDRSIEGAA